MLSKVNRQTRMGAMKVRISILLNLIMVMALLVPGEAGPSVAQSQPPSTRTLLAASPRSEHGKFTENVSQFALGGRFRPHEIGRAHV